MIVDLRQSPPPAADPAATVVVGAGAAGLALALDLEARGLPVVLLESGPGWGPTDDGADDPLNTGEVVGQSYRGLTRARARGIGGSTALWHGQCTRLHEIDLAPRPWLGLTGWPLRDGELDRWYPAAEEWFGLTGRGYGASRWQEHPELTPQEWSPGRLEHDFTEYVPVIHQGRRHRRHLERSALITLVQNATVARVLVEDDRAAGVEVRITADRHCVFPATTVVLSAGTVENARILQLSDPAGVGVGDGRWHTGRHLQDHPVVRTAEIVAPHGRWLQDRYSPLHRGGRRIYPKVRLADTAQRRHELVDATAVLVHEHADEHPGVLAARRLLDGVRRRQLPAAAVPDVVTAAGAALPLGRDVWRRSVHGLSTGRTASSAWVDVWLEQVPHPDSRITLAEHLDPLGLPRARVEWRTSDAEIRTSRLMTRWIGEDLAASGAATLRELPAMTDDGAWRAAVGDAWHPSGTARMSAGPREGVVDPDLRVHGVAGLYVAGASAFPVAGYANPTLTIVALALRLGDHLAAVGSRSSGALRATAGIDRGSTPLVRSTGLGVEGVRTSGLTTSGTRAGASREVGVLVGDGAGASGVSPSGLPSEGARRPSSSRTTAPPT